VVKAPAARVFSVICAPERLPEWNVSVEKASRVTPEEPVGLGSRAIMSGRLLGQSLESETVVVEIDEPTVFVTRAIRGPRLTTRFSLEPQADEGAADGTLVRVEVTGDVPGGVIGERLAEGFLRRELTSSLQRLQTLVEADGSEAIA